MILERKISHKYLLFCDMPHIHYKEFETKINIEVKPIFEFLLPLS